MRKTITCIILLTAAICCHAQTVSEVRAEIARQGIPHPAVVLAQARLETGNFTSKLCRTRHNIFGIRAGKKYKYYRRWQDCVADYKRRISSRYHGGDYYTFLRRIGYASDPRYAAKVRRIAGQ